MRTELPADFLATDRGSRADEILRSCVHCGFCNATCPTYQVLGDELDGPRGRIYLMKEMLESAVADDVTRLHLDRCLTCRACETTCPSGVRYGELLEISRPFLEVQRPRRGFQRWLRRWLLAVVPNPVWFRRWSALGRVFRFALPARLKRGLPPVGKRPPKAEGTGSSSERRVLLLQGCVQRSATPEVTETLAGLLRSRGIEPITVAAETCCGSLALHLGEEAAAQATMARNVAALAGELDGLEAVISTASGCGVTVKDYGRLLADDAGHHAAAERLAALTRDAGEYLDTLDVPWRRVDAYRRVAWHPPCTLQHGQGVRGVVETLLTRAGYELVPIRDAHLCCGSAGTYSLLQPELAGILKERKLQALQAHAPDVIATANVGCQLHLASDAGVPVVHWLELLR